MRTLYLLTHIASQFLKKWLPWPEVRADAPASAVADDPRVVLEGQRQAANPALTWLDKFDAKFARAIDLAAAASSYLAKCSTEGARWIAACDAEFPPLLRLISDPPAGLTVIGDTALWRRPMVAVVGARKASAFAVWECYEVGRHLASAGVTVVSGGAFGCDIAAHHGVLAAGGQPAGACCVFAGGLDRLTPSANHAVFRRLRERGAILVSERLWGVVPRREDFHARNRLISGMSGTTLMMQAAAQSGAMMTARLALDQGRDLAVLTHPEGDVRAVGNALLVTEGAPAFANASAIMSCLRLGSSAAGAPKDP